MQVRYGDGLVTFEVAEDSAVGQAATKNAIRAKAYEKHGKYPQYEGYWDGSEWVLVRVQRNVRTKMGMAFVKGEVALARFREADGEFDEAAWTAYSVTNGINTVVPVAWAEEIKPVLD